MFYSPAINRCAVVIHSSLPKNIFPHNKPNKLKYRNQSMGSLKSLALLALLLSLSLSVFADTSNDAATQAKDEVKPSEATDALEPQQRGGCRYGCCGAFAFGRCSACCSRPQAAEAETEAHDVVVAKDEVKPDEATDAVEPQQRRPGGCRYGCCGAFAFGRCSACCSQPQAAEAKTEANDVVVEPQQIWGGPCRFGCCGGWTFGRCNFCCRRPQDAEAVETKAVEVNDVEPQQAGRGGCRYGCCGSYAFGRCSACCSLSQAQAQAEAVEAVEPQQRGGCRYGCCGSWRYGRCTYCCRSAQAEAEVVEPQQRRICRYGCCGSYAFGQCSACCSKKMATEEVEKKEEAKP